jgi:hypothetical protein
MPVTAALGGTHARPSRGRRRGDLAASHRRDRSLVDGARHQWRIEGRPCDRPRRPRKRDPPDGSRAGSRGQDPGVRSQPVLPIAREPRWRRRAPLNGIRRRARTSTLAGTPSSHRMNARPMDATSFEELPQTSCPAGLSGTRRRHWESWQVPGSGGSRRRFPARLERGSSARASRLGHAVSTAPLAQSGPETSHDDAASSTRRSVTMSCP